MGAHAEPGLRLARAFHRARRASGAHACRAPPGTPSPRLMLEMTISIMENLFSVDIKPSARHVTIALI
jgi:hypothetical protein